MWVKLNIAVILVLASCSNQRVKPRQTLPDQVAICEAILMSEIAGKSAEDRRSIRIFAGTASGNFPDGFYDNFAGATPVVLRMSEAKADSDVRDKLWTFESPKQLTPDSFEIYAGYYCGPLCAKHCTYRVTREGNAWQVSVPSGTCIVS
jgi:hypothetical protein